MSQFQKDELSLEETNKLRISLGLKPLAPDSDDEGELTQKSSGVDDKGTSVKDDDDLDPLKNQDEKAAKNYAAHQEAAKRRRQEEDVRQRIAKAQNRRELNRKLHGRTLGQDEKANDGEAESGGSSTSLDAKKWLKAQRKKAKENTARRLQEEAEAEAAAIANAETYDSKDLRGLRVGHDIDSFDLEDGGEERVLTLRDSRILDNDDDELMDLQLDQTERDRRNEERKKGPKKYTGLDDEEFGTEHVGRKAGILSKYDDDIEQIDGRMQDEDSGFRLGGEMRTKIERAQDKRREQDRLLNRSLLDLDYTKNEEISDYVKEGDAGFKKPKIRKKKRQAAARIRLDDDDDDGARGAVRDGIATARNSDAAAQGAEAVSKSSRSAEVDWNADLIDDDDLAKSLANARRKRVKKTFQKITPEMIARNLAAQREAEEMENGVSSVSGDRAERMELEGTVKREVEDGEAGLTFDETSEFVRNIQAARESAQVGVTDAQRHMSAMKREALESVDAARGTIDGNTLLQADSESLQNVKEESDDEDKEIALAEVEADEAAGAIDGDDETEPSLAGGGLGSTLSLLRNQGLITQITPDQQAREREQQQYDLWLAHRRTEDQVREAELALSKAQGSAKDQAQREYENRVREMEDARKAQDRFKDYRPDIDIKYTDEFGRDLNAHEAWKRLSHVFHGKAPGRKKQEQRLQRIKQEKEREKMLAGDTPSGMSRAFSERAERSGQAHMVLGVGARNNAPQDAALLGPNTHAPVRAKARRPDVSGSGTGLEQVEGYGASSSTVALGGEYAPRKVDADADGVTSMVPRSTVAKTRAGFAPVRSSSGGGGSSGGAQASPDFVAQALPSAGADVQSSGGAGKFKLAFGKRPAASSSTLSNGSGSMSNKQAKFDNHDDD